MTRTSYQHGYVSKPIRKPTGTVFVIRYRVRAVDGRWIHKSETLRGLDSRKAARAILDERIRNSTVSQPVVAADLTFKEFVDGYWKPFLERKGVKPSTLMSYGSALRAHILPLLGDARMQDIAPLHVEQLIQAKLASGKSSKTVCNLVAVLQSVFSLAVDDDVIVRSPVRRKHKPNIERVEKTIWSPAQVLAVLGAAPEKYRALFFTAALSGARLGELLALQWKHIDFSAGKLRIEQSLWNGRLVSPKTASSTRNVPCAPRLLEELRKHREHSMNADSEGFVFCKSTGESLNPDVLRKDVLYPLLDRLQITRVSRFAGFHTFRHSAGSIVHDCTKDLKLAQEFLGHANLNTTADVYVHTAEGAGQIAANALEQAIFGNLFVTVRNSTNNSSKTAVN